MADPSTPAPPDDAAAAMTAAVAEKRKEAAAAAEREAAAAARLAAEAARLKAAYGHYADDVARAAQQNDRLTKAVRDGTYARQAREMARLSREYEKVRREADLIARYGERWGRFAGRWGGAMALAGNLGGRAMETGRGLRERGLSGTVEQNRLELQKTYVGREVAGIYKPVTDLQTKAFKAADKFAAGLTRAQQDLILFGTVAVGLAGTLKTIGLVGRVAGLVGGIGAAGAAAGAGVAAGAAAGAGAGVGAGVAGGAAAGAAGRFGLRAAAGFALKRALPVAGLAYGAYEGTGSAGSVYDEKRAKGVNKFAAGSAAVANFAASTLTAGLWSPFKGDDKAKETEARRRVTLAGGGWEEAGSGFERINTAAAMVDAERAVKDKESEKVADLFRPAAKMLADAAEKLKAASAGGAVPFDRPPS